ncbi:MAG: right-handed parallel beta-helix repeat-containing protein [Nannocystis sp.]|nr:right-handed parallel beta-helix repeat-containing protein [Nannocystis sp.]
MPSPTLEHLAIEWRIDGDDDNDGVVWIRYRSAGGAWREGMPLRRVPAGAAEGFAWPNKHAGSLFGLEPGTEYEVELALLDPDGGCEVRTLSATTRTAPAAMAGAPVIPVTPAGFKAAAAAAGPGDIIELAAGTYAEIVLQTDGSPGAPIVLRGKPGAVVDGDVRLDGRAHVIVDGLEVHGKIKFNGGRELGIVRCKVLTAGDGIVTFTRAENVYIADNEVVGATVWSEAALGVDGDNIGEGIQVTGPGHVIEHNRVRGFRDAISLLEDDGAVDQYSIDILANDISEAADDGIEADFCFHDCRIAGNRLTNTFIALSSQPGLGGPTYFVRNAVYSTILSAFKLQRGSVGDVLLHNTVVKGGDAFGVYTGDVFERQYARNNVFLGGPGGQYGGWSSGTGDVLSLAAAGASVDLDYDGYGSTLGGFTGQIGAVVFASLAQLQAMTTEVHAVELDLSIFAAGVALPSPFPGHDPADLRLAPGSDAVDVGLAIPNINDGHAGSAPDLGAHELGAPLPGYGPRM